MIKTVNRTLSDILAGINTKTLIISSNDLNEDSILVSNPNIIMMSVFGLDLKNAGKFTLYQAAIAVEILNYVQIILIADYPSKILNNSIREFGETLDNNDFAAVLENTKIEIKKDGLVFPYRLLKKVAYLKYQINILEKFMEDYTFKMTMNKPIIKGILRIQGQGILEIKEFEIMN